MMKKAIGMAVANFVGVAAAWAGMEGILTLINGGNFVENITKPNFLIMGGIFATIDAVIAFVKARRAEPAKAAVA